MTQQMDEIKKALAVQAEKRRRDGIQLSPERTAKIAMQVLTEMQWVVTPPSGPSLTELIAGNSTETPPETNSANSASEDKRCPQCKADPGTPGYLRWDVPKEHIMFGRVMPCPLCHDKVMAVRRRMVYRLEGWKARATLDNFVVEEGNQEALTVARAFVQQPKGMLTFWGKYGRGKSHLLAGIYNALIECNVLAAYFTLPDLTSKLRSSVADDPEAFYQYLSTFNVLLIDEVNFADLRQWTREQVFRLLNRRYDTGIGSDGDKTFVTGTVFGMNWNPNNDDDPDLAWLFSRINDQANVVVHVRGEDNRKRRNLLRQLRDLTGL